MSTSDVYCSNCGASNDLDASACFACGKPLTGTSNENDSATTVLSRGTLLHNRYLLLNAVGEGGFATVYRAEDTLSHRTVAIKSIGLAALNAQQMIDATDTYNRELLFGHALKHSHLPTFYDSFTDQDHWYLVVQFIDGPTLETYVQQRPARRLALWEVLDICTQICEVLTYLHGCHPPVIFRDIKPDNIMRSANGTVYLVDFGIARHFQPGKRRDTQLLGSPGYAAPEQYGSAQTSERSDIYSLGVTLQTLLTGSNPLDKANHTFASASVLPQNVERLLARMHAQKPEDRPASAQEVRSALEDIARQEGISSFIPGMQGMQAAQGSDWRPYAMTPPAPYAGGQMSQMVPPPPPPMPPLPSYAPSVAKRKRSLAGWIVAGLVASVLVCIFGSMLLPNHSSSPQPYQSVAGPDQHTLAIGLVESSGAAVLDPTFQATAQDQQVMTMLYSGLTSVNGQNKIVPGLAQSWDARPDGQGLDWTFHLRPNLKFSDGSPLTSADAAYSIDRVFSSPNNEYAYLSPFFKDGNNRLSGKVQTLIGDSLLTPDPSTLIIKEQGRGVFLPTMMSTYCFLVVNQSLVKKYSSDFTDHLGEGGSSGPFKLSGSASSTDLELVPNPSYSYYGGKPQLQQVSVRIYSTIDNERADYAANRLSIMLAPDYDSLTSAEKSDERVTLVSAIDYMEMNYLVKPFDNIKIRQAFALALDKSAIMDGAYKAGTLATNHIIPEGQPAYNPSLTGPAGVSSPHGDVTLARKLLQQGMEEEGIQSIQQFPAVTLTYYSGSSVSRDDEMNLIQQQWNTKLGIKVKLDNNSQLNDKINGSVNNPKGLQIWLSGWLVDYPDPQNWTSLQFTKGSIGNSSNYGQNSSTNAAAQQQVQANLLKADTMQDPQQRLKAYQGAEQQLVNDVAWLPISQNNQADLVKSNVRGYQTNEEGFASPDVVQAMSLNG